MLRLIVVLLFSTLIPSAFATELKFATTLKKSVGHISYVVTNVGNDAAHVNEVDFVDFDKSGHGIFLYDPYTKRVQTGWGTILRSPTMKSAKTPATLLKPGDFLELSYEIKALTRLFMNVPNCFYLVAIYRYQSAGSKLNAVSNAVYICRSK